MIGTKIKKIRELRNYTQEYMAEQLTMSQSGYSKIESNEVEVSFSRLEQIAQALGLKIEDLLAFQDSNVFTNYGSAHEQSFSVFYATSSQKEQELYEKLLAAQEQQITALMKQIQMLEEKINKESR